MTSSSFAENLRGCNTKRQSMGWVAGLTQGIIQVGERGLTGKVDGQAGVKVVGKKSIYSLCGKYFLCKPSMIEKSRN